MTHKETEVFLKDCPRLFSNFLNDPNFCLPYGSGWFDILHKCCLELEVLNKDGTYILFTDADYIITDVGNNLKCGIIKFCVNIVKPNCLYSSYHERLCFIASDIIGRMMSKSGIICECCGFESNKVNNVIENSDFKCVCDSCFEKLKGTKNEQCNN